MLFYCLGMNCFFGLVFVLGLFFVVVGGMENDEVVSIVEDGLFHLTGRGWAVI